MTRRIKRNTQFEINLNIKDESFIRPPRSGQRQWLLNQIMSEFSDDLVELDKLASGFVAGAEQHRFEDRSERPLGDDEIMEDWQVPMMRAMAEIATRQHGSVLEIGFGLGVSADFIQEGGVESHTIVECNDSVVERFHEWKKRYPGKDIKLIHARWQDAADQLEQYDSIFFHTYPLNEAEYIEQALSSATFAEHFFPSAEKLLRTGGVFTYLSNEIDSMSRRHQRALFRYFSRIATRVVTLKIPDDVRDTWWAHSMLAVEAWK